MSTASVLPILTTLTQWTEENITAIIKTTNEKDLTSALDEFLMKDVTIVVNSVQVSCVELEKRLQGKKFEQTATISFVSAVEVPADEDKPFDVSSDSDVCTSTCS